MLRQFLVGLQPLHDRGVVRGRVGERFERERVPRRFAHGPVVGAQLFEERVVLVRVGDDRHPRVVLRRRAHHRRSADVDRVDPGPLEERVQVRHDEVERLDVVAFEIGEVRFLVAVGEEPTVDLRMQRLHPFVEHLRHARDGLDLRHRQARRVERGRGAGRRHELDAEVGEAPRELGEALLVVHRQQRAPDRPSHASLIARTARSSRLRYLIPSQVARSRPDRACVRPS